MSKTFKILTIITSIIIMLTACSSKSTSNNKIKIVSSINFYSEVAKNIAQDKAEVVSIIESSNIDPHDFEPSANDAKKVSDANIAIYNGGGYDSWFEKLTNNNNNITKIDAAKLINLNDGDNEHIWYNPQVLKNVAEQLTEELAKKDNANKDFYIKNKEEYIKELNRIEEKISSLKSKSEGKVVLTTEPVFEYAVKQLNLKTTDAIDRLAKATSQGNDPSPKDLKQIQEDIKNHKITFIVNNTQTTNKTVEGIISLANEHKIPILNVSESKPTDKTYIEWMIDQYNALEKILDSGIGEEAYHQENAKESHSHNHDHDHDHNH
ncbi:zinc ABC transporter substrate-binding protein [Gemella sp. GH3]|uniref:metal ABC transporter solute-binding protein, Zn/Mn family n=1 Tax=unclassified Gemella TaxID=2624949 RepID=UPI0015D08724|nr:MULTISPECIES: zinc ABC transporter substrate-binding protein [unclassified Gemella]MBF0713258.1 zinc ABC transporter substrate-binding protein [Gemella sp. GH3.1]NYS50210.1 zinc ABC transporter substrate-binding protein [Gemella sp. GH3]